MDTLLIFFLNRSILKIVEKNQKPVFNIREILTLLYINLKWRAKFQIYRLHIRDSDWLNCIHFSGYKYKIRLASIKGKWEDQALISISTILKFSAQYFFSCDILHWEFNTQAFIFKLYNFSSIIPLKSLPKAI